MDMWPIVYPAGTEWILKAFTSSLINLPEVVSEDMHKLLLTLHREFVFDWLPVLSETCFVIASLIDQFLGYEDPLAVRRLAALFDASTIDSPVSKPQTSFAGQSYSSEDENLVSVNCVMDGTMKISHFNAGSSLGRTKNLESFLNDRLTRMRIESATALGEILSLRAAVHDLQVEKSHQYDNSRSNSWSNSNVAGRRQTVRNAGALSSQTGQRLRAGPPGLKSRRKGSPSLHLSPSLLLVVFTLRLSKN